jgi:hypothetical protein
MSRNILEEFDRQVSNLISKDYASLARLSVDEFKQKLESLREKLPESILTEVDLEQGTLPFVIVVKSSLVPSDQAMARVIKDGKEGITKLFPHQPTDFDMIENVDIPSSNIYLLIDIDRGKANINLPPNQAMTLIKQAGRSPLTIDEGIAIVTHYPEYLIKNNCFSLLASRHTGDQRVPAIWINGQKQPNLGWCWDGNPHTWLGSASCRTRVGIN